MGELPFHDFFFAGRPVGYFLDEKWPVASGRCRFEPYRGSSLQPGHMPECWYIAGGLKVFFIVMSIPKKGIIEISDVRAERGELPK